MTKKIISIIILICTLVSSTLIMTACNNSNENYPVKVGHLVFDKEPESIVVLSDCVADIISCMGYEVKMVGRSTECSQENLSIVPETGSKSSPDIGLIINSGATVVFADTSISDTDRSLLEEKGISVVTMIPAQSMDELKVMYKSIGKILGGNKTGLEKAEKSYNDLINNLDSMSNSVNKDNIVKTYVYLYMDNGVMKTFLNNSFESKILSYAKGTSITETFETEEVYENILLLGNPTYIFCDETTKEHIQNSKTLKGLNAVKNNNLNIIEPEMFKRQGDSLTELVYKMIYTFYPNEATPNEASPDTQSSIDNSVANQYGIDLTEKLRFVLEQEDDNILALQKRLDDLNYLTVEPTGYYGELTIEAVKAFQENNGLTADGEVTDKTLKAIFSKDAVKSPQPARDKNTPAATEA